MAAVERREIKKKHIFYLNLYRKIAFLSTKNAPQQNTLLSVGKPKRNNIMIKRGLLRR